MLKLNSRITSLAIASAFAATSTIWFTSRASAQNQRLSGFLASGMVGIATGQTLRLNAVSVGVGHEVAVELTFFDSEGNVLARSVDKLLPGRAMSLDLPFRPTGRSSRIQVRTLVRWGTALGPEGYIIPTLEVIDDATGRTTVLEPNYEA